MFVLILSHVVLVCPKILPEMMNNVKKDLKCFLVRSAHDKTASSAFRLIENPTQNSTNESPVNVFLGFGFFLRTNQHASVAKPTVVVHVNEEPSYDWRFFSSHHRINT